MNTIIGLDIGGTKTAVLEGTYEAEILQRREIPTQAQDSFTVTFERICAEVDLVLNAARLANHNVSALSIAIGGPLRIAEGIILQPPHLPNWVDVPLKALLERRYQLPVYVEHDGNAGALAEYYFGAARGCRNVVFLTAGTGLGGGLILDGRIYRGSSDTAGEVGHIRLADTGPVEYGKAGSWEAFCSGAGMVKLAHQLFPSHWPQSLTTRELVTLALDGDRRAREVIVKSGEWLGRGLAILVDTLNPEVIVLGSLGGALGDLYLDPARAVVRSECLPQPASICRIIPAELGGRIGDIAALVAAIDTLRTRSNLNERTQEEDKQSMSSINKPVQSGFNTALADSVSVQSRLAEIAHTIEASALAICEALQHGHKVIVCGNGGSAAQAQHLAGELVGKYGPVRQSLPSIALTADSGVVTCIANDFGYDQLFSRQVEAFAQSGDIVVGITTSGRSPNVLKALEAGHKRGAVTIALTGQAGLVNATADIVVAVPSVSTARIQESHAFIVHYWCDVVDAAFVNPSSAKLQDTGR
ncbi:MAG: ROK family protein [Chloroflexi bacterium]|nr:ROK family protein [Chloroflexota bacterium]